MLCHDSFVSSLQVKHLQRMTGGFHDLFSWVNNVRTVDNFESIFPKRSAWRCRGLNPGPFTCKANALPLSHIPYLILNRYLREENIVDCRYSSLSRVSRHGCKHVLVNSLDRYFHSPRRDMYAYPHHTPDE